MKSLGNGWKRAQEARARLECVEAERRNKSTLQTLQAEADFYNQKSAEWQKYTEQLIGVRYPAKPWQRVKYWYRF